MPRSDLLLVTGALVGGVLAAREIAGRAVLVPADAVAVVDGVAIHRAEYSRALDAVAAERKSGPLSEAERRKILDHLVDEELLFQRAVALDLPRHDARLRAEIVSTLIADLADSAEAREPSDDELAAWLRDHAGRFAGEAGPRPLADVRDAVRADLLKAREEEQLEETLTGLRASADVQVRLP